MDDVIAIASPLGRLELRPERDDDQPFRFELFCKSRPPEWDMVQLDPQFREQLMRHQFEAQTTGYRAQFPKARFDIIELDAEPIGRIVVDRPAGMLNLVDQAIVPQLRSKGLGTTIMRAPRFSIVIPTFNEQMRRNVGPQFRPTYIIHVPIDDQRHNIFVTQLVGVVGAEVEQYMREYHDVQAMRARAPSSEEAAAQIVSGKKTLQDFLDHPLLVEIEDILTQGGQGAIANRDDERLGRTDGGVALLRKIWSRELGALGDGCSTLVTSWGRTPNEASS